MNTLEIKIECPITSAEITIKDYLKQLLETLWDEGESFSSKRPFGDSGWEFALYKALGNAGVVECSFDEEGYIEEIDRDSANKLIFEAISSL